MNIGVFASGRGSNFQAILDAIHQRILTASVSLLLSNKSDAGALEIARAHHIPAVHVSQKQFSDEPSFAAAMVRLLKEHDVQIIALAGYLKKIPIPVVREYRNRILNIHPALLPKFGGKGMYGRHVHQAVIDAGEKESGISIHYVNEKFDEGKIVFQMKCEVGLHETAETLAEKVRELEHKHFPAEIEKLLGA